MENFNLSTGYELPIVNGFRERIKPNWKKVFKTFKYDDIPKEKVNKLKHDIFHAKNLLEKYGFDFYGKKIMDVGCYLGIQCFGAKEMGASEVVGIDIPEYYVNQSTDKEINASQVLEQRRNQIREFHPHLDQSKIKFHDVSVFEMDFENEFDIIFSWETFEHITNPKQALNKIYKALKPGGISYNIYNPFFCLTGGHSMCTLDYPFAHVLMDNNDFKKYTETIIPPGVPNNYSELCYDFFTKNLNRMTQFDLKQYIKEENFKLLDFIPIPDINLLQMIDPSLLQSSKSIHPTLTLNDLLCSYVHFLIQK